MLGSISGAGACSAKAAWADKAHLNSPDFLTIEFWSERLRLILTASLQIYSCAPLCPKFGLPVEPLLVVQLNNRGAAIIQDDLAQPAQSGYSW